MIERTSGERLFFLIRGHGLASDRNFGESWSLLASTLSDIGGSDYFSEYIRGAVAIYAVRRILKLSAEMMKTARPSEAMMYRVVSRLIRSEVFPNIEDEMLGRIARLTIAAELASRQDIPKGVRNEMKALSKKMHCYLCGCKLDPAQTDNKHSEYFTLEHVWPASLGGESILENLLAACIPCQTAKKDALSWEWYNVHNLLLTSSPTKTELGELSKSRRMMIARHVLHAIELCQEEHLSLKEGFVRLGPMRSTFEYSKTRAPVSFFDLTTERN